MQISKILNLSICQPG